MATLIRSVASGAPTGAVTSITLPTFTNDAGNAITVSVFWKNNVTISGISGNGNSYSDSGAGRLARPTDGFLQVHIAGGINAGANAIQVSFSGTATEVEAYAEEWNGLTGATDGNSTGTATSGTTVTTGNIVTTNPAFLYAFCVTDDTNGSAGTNMTAAQAPAGTGEITEYRNLTGAGTYTCSASMSAAITKGAIIGVALKGFPNTVPPVVDKPLTLMRCRPLGPGNPLREVKYYDTPPAAVTGTTIVPDTGALQLDGFSPTLGLPITLVPGFGDLQLTGFAAKFPTTIVAGSGALQLDGFGPSIGLPKTIVPGFGQLTLTGFSATFPRTIVPATGALDLNGFAPTFARTIKPGFGDLQLDGFGPSFSFVSGSYTAQPGLGVLTLTGFGPTFPKTIVPGSGSLTLTGNAPAIGLPITVRPGSGLLTLTGFGPGITVTPLGLFITPGTGQLTLTGYAPWIGTFTFRFAGGPVMTATVSGGGVLVASVSGGPVLTGSMSGGPV